jgi:putative hydrolase of the HAD superfamily
LRERVEFWELFDGIVISGEVNMGKPQPEIFEYLLTRHGLTATDTIFIDDYPANMDAAKALGLHIVLFQNAQQCEAALGEFVGGR